MAAKLKELQSQHQKIIDEISSIQSEKSKHVTTIDQLNTQLGENKLVAQELDLVDESEEEVVFKLVGPALLKQDLDEAKANVAKRIDYITKEIERYTKLVKDCQTREEAAEQKEQELRAKRTEALVDELSSGLGRVHLELNTIVVDMNEYDPTFMNKDIDHYNALRADITLAFSVTITVLGVSAGLAYAMASRPFSKLYVQLNHHVALASAAQLIPHSCRAMSSDVDCRGVALLYLAFTVCFFLSGGELALSVAMSDLCSDPNEGFYLAENEERERMSPGVGELAGLGSTPHLPHPRLVAFASRSDSHSFNTDHHI
ncbi:uncharacterized protein MONBRDRAFT_38649 [Monosiga brevicollis MX1]|uniref:Prefoldin subunit 6 n=1 Tax=Monosiga brevicollis TaxID=81824 RepID=A9V974_MONBE|nr:uncharacterized protein MONBRDRAFT_38649 [Monosiga brevicollis MX1]EDQ85811.1 predicted protein [Monosiga brevicollis MX1]|eukprot:XP_001749290.1 hypothetical protein [Monosiga brevicollis MX1]